VGFHIHRGFSRALKKIGNKTEDTKEGVIGILFGSVLRGEPNKMLAPDVDSEVTGVVKISLK
jgi:hypothetical protein